MKKCTVTVVRKACYPDLSEKYENPLEHACDLEEGQVFVSENGARPDGLCESAWGVMQPFVAAFLSRTNNHWGKPCS